MYLGVTAKLHNTFTRQFSLYKILIRLRTYEDFRTRILHALYNSIFIYALCILRNMIIYMHIYI